MDTSLEKTSLQSSCSVSVAHAKPIHGLFARVSTDLDRFVAALAHHEEDEAGT